MQPFVIFDLDDTLVDYAGAIDLALAAFAADRGLGEDGLAFLRDINSQPLSVEESWRVIGVRFGLRETPDELATAFAAMLPEQTAPFEGAVLGLQSLRAAGWRTALLSNGVEREQRIKMRAGLDELFDAFCFCDEGGIRKPDPLAFAEVARLAGAQLEGAWMVGDSLSSDVAGGQAVGLTTLWISGGQAVPSTGPRPDHVARSIADAIPILLNAEDTQTQAT